MEGDLRANEEDPEHAKETQWMELTTQRTYLKPDIPRKKPIYQRR
jgi:hypothetical protein